MKKILAVILTIVMLLGVVAINSSSDTIKEDTALPIATLVTNDGSPLDKTGAVTQIGDKFIFTLRFDYFIPIKGIDITIDAGDAVITDVKSYNLPSAVLGVEEFDENYVYKRDNHALRFVDINITGKSRIVCNIDSPSATTTVTATGKYADTGETLFKITTKPQNYEMLETNSEQINNDTNLKQPPLPNDRKKDPGYFIPYGAVYKDGKFAPKNTDGSFSDVSGYSYLKFKLPREIKDGSDKIIRNLTPFGAATEIDPKPETDNPALTYSAGSWRFGSYSEYDDFSDSNNPEINTKQTKMHHGTMMFVGDWLSLKEHYVKQGNTVQQFVKAIYEEMTRLEQQKDENGKPVLGTNVVDEFTSYHVSYEVPDRNNPGKTTWIDVYKYPRKHYIWRDFGAEYDDDGKIATYGKLEYAIRLHNMQPNRTYTAVAYCLKSGESHENAEISHNVKSIHLNDNYEVSGAGTNLTLTEKQEIPTFEQGNFNPNNSINPDQPTRLCTEKYYLISDYEKITIHKNYRVYINSYDEDYTLKKSKGWCQDHINLNDDKTIDQNAKYFRIVLKRPIDEDKNIDRIINPTNIPKDAVILTKK
jgi:hypothetical protein